MTYVYEIIGKPLQRYPFSLMGLEVEVEYSSEFFPRIDISEFWGITLDGSLRGPSREFVSRRPVSAKKLKEETKKLIKTLVEAGPINYSGRAGIHIHINVRDLPLKELFNYIIIYYILEDILIPEERKGNLFCLGLKEAEGVIEPLIKLKRHKLNVLNLERDARYAALNIAAIKKYGSLEFRALGLTKDISIIETYIDVFLEIKRKCKMFADGVHILQMFSGGGGLNFAQQILGELLDKLPNKATEESLMTNMRLIQEVVYS